MAETLTQSEFNVAYPIACGKTTNESAVMNRLSYWKTRALMSSVYLKLGVHNHMELSKALERGEF